MATFHEEEIQFEVYPERMFEEPEDQQFDNKEEVVAHINELREETEWGWCTVVVRGTYRNLLEAEDILSGCSYESKEEFTAEGGYYEDMKNTVTNLLKEKFETLIKD